MATEKTDYDRIAENFKKSTSLGFRKHIEEYTFLERVSALIKGKKALDLATGDGRFARIMADVGAAEVVGVDKSREMIRLAEKNTEQEGIKYECQDAAELSEIAGGNFDVVTAIYLLHYATNPEELAAFCTAIFLNLKPGGTFVALNVDMHTSAEYYNEYIKYGVDINASTELPRKEGSTITFTLDNGDGTFVSMDNYYLHPETYEQEFTRAGFTDFSWESISVSPQGLREMGEKHWQHFLDHPIIAVISAKKPLAVSQERLTSTGFFKDKTSKEADAQQVDVSLASTVALSKL